VPTGLIRSMSAAGALAAAAKLSLLARMA
jgi:hypothetical protein